MPAQIVENFNTLVTFVYYVTHFLKGAGEHDFAPLPLFTVMGCSMTLHGTEKEYEMIA